ncbi:MAG: DEAD/DEAH box helicase family protein [Albidovulum sp.]|nr:DEAD/DEAH box helicase family protein [Albidovulum sp.]
MSLREIVYKEDYRSGYDNIVEDLFRPSLARSNAYWRAVGYFSSSALESFGAPLGDFIKNGGHIRLVTSVELSQSDLEAIQNGALRQDICAQRLEQIIDTDFADGIGDGTGRLLRLLELGRLEIQIAVPKTGTGIYHEKIGLFFDDDDFVAFTGSSNESRSAFENNRECVDVYPSWNSAARAFRKKTHFEELWECTDQGVEVYSFPDAVRQKLIKVCGEWEAGRWKRKKDVREEQDKWRHQEEALEEFLDAERGVLNMATGTGKTRTALKIVSELFERSEIDTVIVSTDGNDLLDQWYSELLKARKSVDRTIRVFCEYKDKKERQSFSLDPANAFLLAAREPVAGALRELSLYEAHRSLLIHDEVHGLGSPGNRKRLSGVSDNVRFRLGLSATPERVYDQEGNEFIEDHIGPVIKSFGLKEGIERGILAPFNYYPLSYTLNDEDRGRLAAVYRKKKAREVAGSPMSDTELWIDLSRVYKTSEAKLPIFERYIKDNTDLLRRCIIFAETMAYGDKVRDIVHGHRPDFHTYYSGEHERTLRRFASGELECLITCHRLSEGIDIKSLNSVVLFSSERAQLETIQRIGRCLRSNPDDPGKIADVVDFVRESEDDGEANADEIRRDWLLELSEVRPTE